MSEDKEDRSAAGTANAAVEGAPLVRAPRGTAARRTVRIVINADWCKGCYICVSVCPRDVLTIDRSEWTGSHHPIVVTAVERCGVCRNCELLCPDLAIEVLSEG